MTVIDGDTDTARVLERVTRGATLRAEGWTWQRIADEIGYASRGAAANAVLTHLRETNEEAVRDARAVWNARYEALVEAMWPQRADPKVARAITQVGARYARMNGLDAPVQVELSASTKAEVMDALAALEESVMGEVLDRTDVPVVDDLPELS